MAYFEWLLPIKSHDHVIHSWQRVPTILFHEDPPIAYPSFFHVLTNPPSPTYTHPNTLPTFLDWMSNCATFDVLFYFYDIMDLHMPSLIPQGMFLLNGGIGEGESTPPHPPSTCRKFGYPLPLGKIPPASRLPPPKVNPPSRNNPINIQL